IDQFVMRGGKLVVLEDAIQLMGGALQARQIRSGLESLLPHYGARIDETLVLEPPPMCATAGFNSGFIRFMVPYPFWPRIVPEGFNSENPVVSKLESLVLPWTSPISESDLRPETVEFVPLATTTERSWTQSGPYNLNPQQQFAPQGETSPHVVAAALVGSFTSYYADRDIPAAPADTTGALTATGTEEEGEKLAESQVPSQIVVVGTSHMVRENFLQQFPANLTFLLNAVDWLTLGNELISIRSRSVSDRPLEPEILADEAEGTRNAIKFLGIFGMPIALGVFGVTRWMARRRAKRSFEEHLHPGDAR
ncbi:MAG: hypothetical protein PVF43_03825, partial [Candidatus Eiseniibacteriota bacterium]